MLKEDKTLVAVTHFSQLVSTILIPLILWLTQRDKIIDMNDHGKAIMNFQLSMFIYTIICVPLIFLGIGILGLIAISLLELFFPIINGIKASKGQAVDYPFSIKFLK